jgi:hypothetical protein
VPDAEATQAFLDAVYQRGMQTLNVSAAVDASALGDAVYKVRLDEDRVKVELVSPAVFLPIADALDETKLMAAEVGHVLRDEKGEPWLWLERYEVREREGEPEDPNAPEAPPRVWLTNRLFRAQKGGMLGVLVDQTKDEVPLTMFPATAKLPPEQDTGLDVIPLVHVANGEGDYPAVEMIQGAINNRGSRIDSLVDRHNEPWVKGPKSLINDTGQVVSGHRFIPTEPGMDTEVEYITWDGQLTAADNRLTKLKQDFASVAGIWYGSMVPPESGGPVSGRALRLSEAPTQATVGLLAAKFVPALQRVFSIATKLANVAAASGAYTVRTGERPPTVLQPEQVQITLGDGLPPDSFENAQEVTMDYTTGIMSRETAVRSLHADWGESQIAEELQRLADAETAAMQPPPMPSGTTPRGSTEVGPGNLAAALAQRLGAKAQEQAAG